MPSPGWIQATGSALSPSDFIDIKFNAPHPTLAGNSGLIYVEFSGSHTFTITDDKSNTWAEVTGAAVTTGAQDQRVYYCQTMTTGTQSFAVTANTSAIYWRAQFIEVCGVSTVNTSGSSIGTSTTPNTNVTTGASGCLIVHFCTQGTVDGYFSTTTINPAASYEMVLASNWDGNATQSIVQAGSGSITPTVTFPSSVAWSSSVVALNASAGAGTALPTGVARVRRRQFYSGLASQSISLNLPGDVTTVKLQFPRVDGSCVVYSTHQWNNDSNDHSVTSITDANNNNFYSAAISSQFISGQRADLSIWYSPNASATTPLDTLNYANLVTEITCAAYEVIGLPNTTKGATYTSSGNDSGADPFTAGIITPTKVGSLIIANIPVELSTVISSTLPTAFAFDGFWATGMDGGFNRMEEDNGHGHYVSPSLTQQTWTWSTTSGNASNWGIVMAEFVQGAAVSRSSPATIRKLIPVQQRTDHA